jgi:DNA-binding transcriptional ArsR family regulator
MVHALSIIQIFKYLKLSTLYFIIPSSKSKGRGQSMDERARRLAWTAVFSALASEPRLQIVELLAQRSVQCQEIQSRVNLSQPAISYHLSKLEQAGVLQKERQGTRNCYRLQKGISDLVRLMTEEGGETWIIP